MSDYYATAMGYRRIYGFESHVRHMDTIDLKRKEAIQEFERMRDTSELKALSSFSLENPLSDKQYKRMMELATKLGFK